MSLELDEDLGDELESQLEEGSEEIEELEEVEEEEVEEEVEEGDGEEQIEEDPYADLKEKFKGEDGNVDLGKVLKSYKEAQKLISETRKTSPEDIKSIELGKQFVKLYTSNPKFKEAVDDLYNPGSNSGKRTNSQQSAPEVNLDNIDAEIAKAKAAGDTEALMELKVQKALMKVPALQKIEEVEKSVDEVKAQRAWELDNDRVAKETNKLKSTFVIPAQDWNQFCEHWKQGQDYLGRPVVSEFLTWAMDNDKSFSRRGKEPAQPTKKLVSNKNKAKKKNPTPPPKRKAPTDVSDKDFEDFLFGS